LSIGILLVFTCFLRGTKGEHQVSHPLIRKFSMVLQSRRSSQMLLLPYLM